LEDRTLLSTWVPEGPSPVLLGNVANSGRIAALAADPTNANTIYIAAAGGGVWKTTDGGTSWIPLTDNQQTLFMGAIAVAPSDPNTIYAGTGEADNSGDSFYGRGVLKSTDAGATWTLLGNSQFDRRTISKVVVSPTDPNTVYVAVANEGTNGASVLRPNTGVWKSTDGGITWTNTTTRVSTTQDYSDLVMDPLDPQTLYAAVGTLTGALANGVYKTSDGGNTWAVAGNFPKGSNNGNTKIAIAPTNRLVLYVSIANPYEGSRSGALGKMMKSVDGGLTWNQLTNPPNYMGSQGWYDSTLAVDPSTPNTVYAGGAARPNSIIRSLDGGNSWSDLSVGSDGQGPHADHHGIGFDAAGRLLDGNDGGIWRLDNQTPVRWSNLNGNLQITQFYGIALHPTDPKTIYGGSQDNGTDKTTGSLAWTEFSFGGDGGYVRIDSNNPHTVYHTFEYQIYGSIFLQRSDNDGTTWVTKTTGINTSDAGNAYPFYVIDPSNSSRLLLGTNRVYESTNRGDNWTPISTPTMNGWVVASPIDRLAVAPTDGNTIYVSVGGDFGNSWHIFVTTNDGGSWIERDLPVTGQIAGLQVDPTNSQIAYAVRNAFGGGHVFRTTDGGVSWTDISGNLPNLPAYTIALGSGTIYIGNDDGVYFSTDSGANWTRLGDGLPNVQVHELVLNAAFGILAAGTYGRGVWELNVGSVATHFLVTPSANPVTAGSASQFTVTAVDDQNNPVTSYSGTIHFSSSDGGATLPGDYTFTAADAGVHVFIATLITAGNQTITATDAAAGISGTGILTVTPAAADHFLISAPAGSTAGNAMDVSVTALDPYNNIDVNYQGTVHFTTSDGGAATVLPPDITFTAADAGVHTFPGGVTLVTAGSQTITVTDTVTGISGTASIAVTAGTPDHLLLTAPDTVFSGLAFDITVTVLDAFNNTIGSYLGTVQFTSTDSDPGVVLPTSYAFTAGDAGMHTFVAGVTFITLGSQTLRVDDPSLGITGTVTVNVVAPAAPPGGRGRSRSSPGGLVQWNGIVRPLAPFVPPTPSATTSSETLPTLVLDETSVTAVFAAIPGLNQRSYR
jgi:photosystem II stability/assembly factor-like uncharacterized protein